ncbi:hypothetical protein PILCRDRAFT_602906 [Piloderma croceum F 1598]|uniref:Uncharacterized protein n=1 Tax=Piloderma croceum (strain F 1598) TaxID=765440 RepID=A0A0C3EZX1_PILCF|nr:hypothetical protein PILCRDRAFT_602906 [Piloderma croceum F 1598]
MTNPSSAHTTTTDGAKKATVDRSLASDRDSWTYSDPSGPQVNPLNPQTNSLNWSQSHHLFRGSLPWFWRSLRSFYSDDIVQLHSHIRSILLATTTQRPPSHRYSPVLFSLTLCMCAISFTLPHSEFPGWEVSCTDCNERC